MTNSKTLADAIAKFRSATTSAVNFHDPDLTNSAITRRRHQAVMQARSELLKALPPQPDAPKVNRATVLAGRAPKSADQVAMIQQEFSIVERLLAAGQPIEQIILNASPARLDAILAHAEILPSTLRSTDPTAVVEAVRGHVFDRLVETGDPNAVMARDAQLAHDRQVAWREVITGTIEGDRYGRGLAALHRTDPEGFEALAAVASDPVTAADTGERVRHLDRVFGIGVSTAGD